jgi:hypothetical protein
VVMILMMLQIHCKYEIVSPEIAALMPIFLPTIMPFCSETCLHEHVGNHCTNLETAQGFNFQFCNVAELSISHKMSKSNLATTVEKES